MTIFVELYPLYAQHQVGVANLLATCKFLLINPQGRYRVDKVHEIKLFFFF